MIAKRNIVIDGPDGKPIILDYYLPVEKENTPILVFCHGYKGFKDWGAWNNMAEYFVAEGIAVLKFNFSFNGGTVSQPIDFPDLEAFGKNNYSRELRDLETVLDYIHSEKQFDKPVNRNLLIVMGHSRGGGIAALKASTDKRIKKLITLAGVSDFENRFNIGSEEFENWKERGVKYILNGRTRQQMPHYFQFYEDFEANKDSLNIKAAVSSLKKPHLIIHGDADTSVSIDEAHNMKKWNPNAQLEVISGTDHVFGTRHPWQAEGISEHLKIALDKSIEFIKDNLDHEA